MNDNKKSGSRHTLIWTAWLYKDIQGAERPSQEGGRHLSWRTRKGRCLLFLSPQSISQRQEGESCNCSLSLWYGSLSTWIAVAWGPKISVFLSQVFQAKQVIQQKLKMVMNNYRRFCTAKKGSSKPAANWIHGFPQRTVSSTSGNSLWWRWSAAEWSTTNQASMQRPNNPSKGGENRRWHPCLGSNHWPFS